MTKKSFQPEARHPLDKDIASLRGDMMTTRLKKQQNAALVY